MNDNKSDNKADAKSAGDVEDLVSSLKLHDLNYREFAVRKPVSLELAGGSQAHAAPAVPVPVAKAAPPPAAARPLDPPKLSPAPVGSTPKVLVTPVNFAFERLRRQAIGSRGDAVVLNLRLPPRPALQASMRTRLLLPLAETFAQLATAVPPRVRS